MLTVDLTGNCGNQQIGYAITRVVAETLGYDFGINRIPSNDYYNGRQQLDFFDLSYGKEHHYGFNEIPEGIKYIYREPKKTFHRPELNDSYDYFAFDPGIFRIPDNTKVIGIFQDAHYYNHKKEDMKKWFQVKEEKIIEANNFFDQNEIKFDDNLCVLNIRGGPEYKSVSNLLLRKSYWINSMSYMKSLNPKMHFIVITDDVEYSQELLGLPTYHFNISTDYYALTQSKNLILSNSSFAIMPTYLSDNAKKVVAPYGWARYNCSDGYFANADFTSFNWEFMRRDGTIYANI
jgi:hypothetical protein